MPVTSGELLFSMLYNFFCFSVFCVCYTLVLYVYLRSPVSQSTLEKGVTSVQRLHTSATGGFCGIRQDQPVLQFFADWCACFSCPDTYSGLLARV